jgi:ATP adenylyltransferase
MERLWAPWRLDYVQAPRADQCVFCLGDPLDDPARLVLHRGEHCFIIMNRYPYSNGHLMVAPFRHLADLGLLTAGEAAELHRLTVLCRDLLNSAFRPQGFNIGINLGAAGGAGITEHMHQHIVPRWIGDTNFMPVFADVRVIPQHLDATCQLFRQILKEMTGDFR